MMHRDVVISGVAVVNAAGFGMEQAWDTLVRSGPPSPKLYKAPDHDETEFPVYSVPEYSLADAGVPCECDEWLKRDNLAQERDLRHLLAATGLALKDAGLSLPGDWTRETGVVVACEYPGGEALSRKLFMVGRDGPLPETTQKRFAVFSNEMFRLNTFLVPHYVAKVFRLGGFSLFVNSACTSGLNALDTAAEQIRRGRANITVVAAADDTLSVAKFLWFDQFGLYAPDGCLRPFDSRARGTVFGDGGAALVLESRKNAAARCAPIYAVYRGAGFAQDGWRVTVPNPTLRRYGSALERALADAGVRAEDIDLLVPHGTGIPATDAFEARTFHEIFGGNRWPSITALKPMCGHNLGGSALMETAILLAAMRAETIPPTFGYEVPLSRFALPLQRTWEQKKIRVAMKASAGFGGYYGAAIFADASEY